MRTTIQVCGNRLSLSSKAFTYSYLLFAITAGSPRLLTSPPHSPTDSSSRTREATNKSCKYHKRKIKQSNFQSFYTTSKNPLSASQNSKPPPFGHGNSTSNTLFIQGLNVNKHSSLLPQKKPRIHVIPEIVQGHSTARRTEPQNPQKLSSRFSLYQKHPPCCKILEYLQKNHT